MYLHAKTHLSRAVSKIQLSVWEVVYLFDVWFADDREYSWLEVTFFDFQTFISQIFHPTTPPSPQKILKCIITTLSSFSQSPEKYKH